MLPDGVLFKQNAYQLSKIMVRGNQCGLASFDCGSGTHAFFLVIINLIWTHLIVLDTLWLLSDTLLGYHWWLRLEHLTRQALIILCRNCMNLLPRSNQLLFKFIQDIGRDRGRALQEMTQRILGSEISIFNTLNIHFRKIQKNLEYLTKIFQLK